MTSRYTGDCCPACGSYQVTPYALVLGSREEYGYRCDGCEITWRVLVCDATTPVASGETPAA